MISLSIAFCVNSIFMGSRIKDALPFREFARRRQVLALFRSMLRAASRVEDMTLRASISKEIASGFQRNRDLKDPVSVKATIQEAYIQMKHLQAMSQDVNDPESWINQSDPDDVRGRVGRGWPWS